MYSAGMLIFSVIIKEIKKERALLIIIVYKSMMWEKYIYTNNKKKLNFLVKIPSDDAYWNENAKIQRG